MGHYAESQQMDDTDYGEKDCPRCEGMKVLCSNCDEGGCDCGEPELIDCYECEGTGKVDRDVEDETSDQWDAQCED